jgi:hypothetical protein
MSHKLGLTSWRQMAELSWLILIQYVFVGTVPTGRLLTQVLLFRDVSGFTSAA